MEKQHTFKLVEGTFSPSDSADILFSLIGDKIKFHQLQILSLREGFHEDSSYSEQRIAVLKRAKNEIKDLILEARDEGFELEIKSNITINFIKRNLNG